MSNESVTSVKNSNYLSHLWRIRTNFSQVWQIHANPSLLWRTRTIFSTAVIRTHDVCDKFIKKSICNAFIFTAVYLPKHNTVLWKEKCWGDIRFFLRRHIGRTRRWVSRLNRSLFCPSVKHEKSGNVRQPFIHFPINGSLIWRQILNYTAEIQLDTEGNILTKLKKIRPVVFEEMR